MVVGERNAGRLWSHGGAATGSGRCCLAAFGPRRGGCGGLRRSALALLLFLLVTVVLVVAELEEPLEVGFRAASFVRALIARLLDHAAQEAAVPFAGHIRRAVF